MANSNQQMFRQWTLLRSIPRYPQKITANILMGKLQVDGFKISKRMVERDLQALSETFPLTCDDRERPYGWSWAKGAAAFDMPGLSASEALTFKMAEQYLMQLMPSGMLAQLQPYFKAANDALERHCDASDLVNWPEKVAVALPSQALLPAQINEDVTTVVDESLLHEKQITIDYQPRGEESPKHYTLHPLGLVLRGPVSYLIATVYNYQDVCLFAMHRIQSAVILDQACKRPADFNLQTFVESGKLGFQHHGEIELKAKFSQAAGQHLYETQLSHDQLIESSVDGSLIVTATVQDNSQLRWWLRGFGHEVKVLEPASLVDWFGKL